MLAKQGQSYRQKETLAIAGRYGSESLTVGQVTRPYCPAPRRDRNPQIVRTEGKAWRRRKSQVAVVDRSQSLEDAEIADQYDVGVGQRWVGEGRRNAGKDAGSMSLEHSFHSI